MKNTILIAKLTLLFFLIQIQSEASPGNEIQDTTIPTNEWRQLFNGKDLTGWKHVGGGSMILDDGMLHGKGGMGLIYWTKEKFSNCTFRVVYKMQKVNSNAGVFIRIPIEPREEWMPVFYGYEVQIDNHPEQSNEGDYHCTGTLYSLTKALSHPGKPGPEWIPWKLPWTGRVRL
ncbi:MAG TPA: DUF1080 domain-containing protein [Flavitalea sp.]|nr:DUF1080 domain-containing protein [Flavitalea sp.]